VAWRTWRTSEASSSEPSRLAGSNSRVPVCRKSNLVAELGAPPFVIFEVWAVLVPAQEDLVSGVKQGTGPCPWKLLWLKRLPGQAGLCTGTRKETRLFVQLGGFMCNRLIACGDMASGSLPAKFRRCGPKRNSPRQSFHLEAKHRLGRISFVDAPQRHPRIQ